MTKAERLDGMRKSLALSQEALTELCRIGEPNCSAALRHAVDAMTLRLQQIAVSDGRRPRPVIYIGPSGVPLPVQP